MDPIAHALHELNNGLHVAKYLLSEIPANTQSITVGVEELKSMHDRMEAAKKSLSVVNL